MLPVCRPVMKGAARGLYGLVAGIAVLVAVDPALAAQRPITFTETIAPILYQHCVPCHRPGGIGPFSLIDYSEVHARADLIAAVTKRRSMPPWKPTAPVGEFQGERRLTATQIDLIARWSAAGGPEGPPAARPRPPDSGNRWQLGPPDLVVSLEPYT